MSKTLKNLTFRKKLDLPHFAFEVQKKCRFYSIKRGNIGAYTFVFYHSVVLLYITVQYLLVKLEVNIIKVGSI